MMEGGRAGGLAVEVEIIVRNFSYDAQGTLAKKVRPGADDAVSAKTAWDRTLEFLKKALA